ncbi:sensor histidine kinase [Polyangium fumosum]|uniref:histidine kinase n=1 Tax=Polyangium fumosum TaxID=889272 RepID=A0A4U1J7J5_9BACT|nr:HAMP domain-containing sensor histidine kinase [Polyangium fumosum]TKD02747.1 HAMP domain-containing histidine kinase [Polyangium fumosum]
MEHDTQPDEPRAAPPDLLILLRPNGTVLGGAGGVPTTWLERRPDGPAVSEAVAKACEDTCSDAGAGVVAFRRVVAEVDGQLRTLLLVSVDALPMRRSLVRVPDLLMTTLDRFLSQARAADVELALHKDPSLPPVLYGDEEKLAWLLATLLGNAVRLAACPDAAAPRVDLAASFDRATNEFVFIVSDNGPGMPESTRRWLFERDPRTGRSAGLALLMVKDVVVAHHGSIDVASRVGEGSRFTVRIPRGHARA